MYTARGSDGQGPGATGGLHPPPVLTRPSRVHATVLCFGSHAFDSPVILLIGGVWSEDTGLTCYSLTGLATAYGGLSTLQAVRGALRTSQDHEVS